jgi:hypothetical protein
MIATTWQDAVVIVVLVISIAYVIGKLLDALK